MSTMELSRFRAARPVEAEVVLVRDDGEENEMYTAALRRPGEADEAVRRIRADYREMPGLRVTVRQGARLWHLQPALCGELLDALVASAFLVRSGDHYRMS